MAITEARAAWFTDQTYRQWVISKGGIYVPVSKQYPPSPYLSHIPERDIATPSGKKLTLINSSYMVRQVHSISSLSNVAKVHITSLKPLRPQNNADKWETQSLLAFEKGEKELYSFSQINDMSYLRLMRPMVTTKECLKCHAQQGYQVGDIRGGVSVSVPFAPYEQASNIQKRSLFFWHSLIALFGVIILFLALNKIRSHEMLLEKALDDSKQANEQVKEFNKTLEQRVKDEVNKSRQKDLLLIQQSRLASMGEMIHNIAHQWRQPLNALAVILSNIQDDYKYNELNDQRLSSAVDKSQMILNQMSSTIDDFRDFFRSDKEAKSFLMEDIVADAMVVIDASLKNNNIAISTELQQPLTCYGFPTQMAQVILNLLTNSKDAMKERHIQNGIITIRSWKDENSVITTICDNGGGIDESIIDKIFDPYFTTKESGSGIGLYMSQMIVERNHNGTVSVANHENGVCFTISLPHHDLSISQKELI